MTADKMMLTVVRQLRLLFLVIFVFLSSATVAASTNDSLALDANIFQRDPISKDHYLSCKFIPDWDPMHVCPGKNGGEQRVIDTLHCMKVCISPS